MKLTFKIWLLISILALSLISVFGLPPAFMQSGVVIETVGADSLSFNQGLRQGQRIIEIDGIVVDSIADFSTIMSDKYATGENVKTIIKTDKIEAILFSNSTPELTVRESSDTNLKLGLDLAGGSRALIKAKDKELSTSELSDLVSVVSNRLNVYGIADMKVAPVSDLSGNNYMLVEIAGATPDDLEKLISEQGKFEAKIGNETVFIGGKGQGVSSVARSGQGAGIYECSERSGSHYCNFRFSIFLSEVAAKKQGEVTGALDVNATNPGYLSEPLNLYLDDKLVNSLQISEGLKGRAEPQISISGSGQGETRDEAVKNAQEEMKQLQTVLITGSLPFKLEIVKLDTISPTLGNEFIQSILLAGVAALIAIALVVFIRYRNFKSALALILTSASEVIIVLGIASFIDWNLDLASIAGIIAGVGTGIDSQIIVLDESNQKTSLSLKEKLKRAFKIIMGSYFTAVVALIPIMWAGAGLLKGFAITTIIGITVGVLITRPAFSDMISLIHKK